MQYTLKRLIDKHPELCEQLKAKCYAINGACAAVHRELGPFLNEYMYQEALQILLDEQQIPFQREYYFQVIFHGKQIGILWNFAPPMDQAEHYYLDTKDSVMYMF